MSPLHRPEPIVGVLMLDTHFPRFSGDIGNPDSLSCKVLYRVVPAATVSTVVTADTLSADVLDGLVDAARELVDQGAELITTSCGFLHCVQGPLAARLSVPVITSALLVLPWLRTLMGPTAPIGVLTFDADALAPQIDDTNVCVIGLADSPVFHAVIQHDRPTADRALMEADVVEAATELARQKPLAVILECTNLSPYRPAIDAAVAVPVYDLIDAINVWLRSVSRLPAPPLRSVSD